VHGANVRFTVLAPGRVETNLYDEALGGHDAAVERLYSGAAAVQPADIAALVSMALTSRRSLRAGESLSSAWAILATSIGRQRG